MFEIFVGGGEFERFGGGGEFEIFVLDGFGSPCGARSHNSYFAGFSKKSTIAKDIPSLSRLQIL